MTDTAADAPQGYKLLRGRSPFVQEIGPLYYRVRDADLQFGLRVVTRHCNALGICHGGVLLTLADIAMGSAAMYFINPRKSMLTVALSTNFQAAAEAGLWVEASAEITGYSSSLAFARVSLTSDAKTLLSGVGSFHVPREETPQFDLRLLLA